jgi:hypothetical protein
MEVVAVLGWVVSLVVQFGCQTGLDTALPETPKPEKPGQEFSRRDRYP